MHIQTIKNDYIWRAPFMLTTHEASNPYSLPRVPNLHIVPHSVRGYGWLLTVVATGQPCAVWRDFGGYGSALNPSREPLAHAALLLPDYGRPKITTRCTGILKSLVIPKFLSAIKAIEFVTQACTCVGFVRARRQAVYHRVPPNFRL